MNGQQACTPPLHDEADHTKGPDIAATPSASAELSAFSKDIPTEGCFIDVDEIPSNVCQSEQEEHVPELIDSQLSGIEQQLMTLQKQNSMLLRKNQELSSSMLMNQILQEEIERLQDANELLESYLSKFTTMEKNPFLIDKVENLEAQLAEALESTDMYKSQLKSFSEKEKQFCLIDLEDLAQLDKVKDELSQYKNKVANLEEELCDITKRYYDISLELAEVEEARCQILITIHQVKQMNCTLVLAKKE